MRQIGIRAFKAQASEVLRDVREKGESLEVTYRGRPFARVVPVTETTSSFSPDEFWERWDRLAHEIGKEWPKGLSAVDAVREDRREF